MFRVYCQACHGPGGKGTSQAPALAKVAQGLAAGKGEADLRRRLSGGGQMMPAFSYLGDAQVKALLGYLSQLGGGAAPAPVAATARLSASGEDIYQGNCASCHAPGRAAAAGMMCQPESLVGATKRFNKRQVMNLLDVGVGPMPAFGNLTGEERDSLWTYIGTLKAEPGQKPAPAQTCAMVRVAMEGKASSGMMHGRGHMRGGGMMGGGMMGGGMMGGNTMGGMMHQGAGCPVIGPSSSAEGRVAQRQLPPCCR